MHLGMESEPGWPGLPGLVSFSLNVGQCFLIKWGPPVLRCSTCASLSKSLLHQLGSLRASRFPQWGEAEVWRWGCHHRTGLC